MSEDHICKGCSTYRFIVIDRKDPNKRFPHMCFNQPIKGIAKYPCLDCLIKMACTRICDRKAFFRDMKSVIDHSY